MTMIGTILEPQDGTHHGHYFQNSFHYLKATGFEIAF